MDLVKWLMLILAITELGKITLYRNKEAVRRNIPSAEARDQLIDLIKEHGMWVDPPKDA